MLSSSVFRIVAATLHLSSFNFKVMSRSIHSLLSIAVVVCLLVIYSSLYHRWKDIIYGLFSYLLLEIFISRHSLNIIKYIALTFSRLEIARKLKNFTQSLIVLGYSYIKWIGVIFHDIPYVVIKHTSEFFHMVFPNSKY